MKKVFACLTAILLALCSCSYEYDEGAEFVMSNYPHLKLYGSGADGTCFVGIDTSTGTMVRIHLGGDSQPALETIEPLIPIGKTVKKTKVK